MKASYHTHTSRCRHASGTDEEYIEKAIAEGVEVLGFSDHAPMHYENGFVSYYKMLPEEAEEYFSSLVFLREKYKDKIEIKIGFETEYYPSLWEDSLRFWSKFPLDYLILGQHYVPDESSDSSEYVFFPTDEKLAVTEYVNACIKGMNTGVISCLAHPDIINYCGSDEKFFINEMRRLISEANSLGIPLEYNLLGMRAGRNYPNPIFWREAARLGASVILGCDSHSPDRVANQSEIIKAKKFLAGLKITPLEKIELKKPF